MMFGNRDVKNIRFSAEANLILLILFCAVFNDILRIPETKLSLFRILIPLAIVIILRNYAKTRKLVELYILFFLLSFFQNLFYYSFFEFENQIDFVWIIQYQLLYLSIFIIFALIRLLRSININIFLSIYDIGFLYLSILLVMLYVLSVFRFPLHIDNRNNYACGLAIVFPWLLIKASKRKVLHLFLALLIPIELYWGDSKLALIGVLLQLQVLIIVKLAKIIRNGNRFVPILIGIAALVGVAIIMNPNTNINGYYTRELAIGVIGNILKNDLYPEGPQSLYVRTNATIHLLRVIPSTFLIGLGPGNSSRLLGVLMPNLAQLKNSQTLSPHNGILEFIVDGGIPAIYFVYVLAKFGLTKLFRSSSLSESNIFSMTVILTFFVWGQSASGILTIYIIFIVFAWTYENQIRLKEDEKKYCYNFCTKSMVNR